MTRTCAHPRCDKAALPRWTTCAKHKSAGRSSAGRSLVQVRNKTSNTPENSAPNQVLTSSDEETKVRSTPTTTNPQRRNTMATETKTRTRKATGTESKAQKDDAATKAAVEAREAAKAAEKAEKDAAKAAEKEAAAKAKEEAKAAKESERAAERQALIDSGDLIVNDNVEFHVVTDPKKDTVAQRAQSVIERLQETGREIPVAGKDLAEEFGGGTVQWVAFFGMLGRLGLVKAYRYRTGNRGEGGVAYLWIGE